MCSYTMALTRSQAMNKVENEHFDVCLSKRRLAVRHGAVEVTRKELVKRMLLKRGQAQTL